MLAIQYINDWKEAFSKAYVRAVAAAAGIAVGEPPQPDRDSVDISFRSLDSQRFPRRPQLDAQLKCTGVADLRAQTLAYDLSPKNYNDLRVTSVVPRILIVVCVPEQNRDWLAQSEAALVLRRCAYWVSLTSGATLANRRSLRVQLPRANVFGIDALHQLMDDIDAGRFP